MPRGIPNNKAKTSPAPAPAPEPLIILQPEGDAWHFNAYGIDLPDILRALRLSLIHLAATQAGVTTIEATISPRNILLASAAAGAPGSRSGAAGAPGSRSGADARRTPTKAKPAQNAGLHRRAVSRDYDPDDDPDEIDLRELMEDR